jgi:murein DD-endopeptidase MepM/ murein hydrolase activator NlpD
VSRPRNILLVPHRPYDARHRSSRRTATRRRLLNGLVLSTAAAALALTTTGATVQTDSTAQATPVVRQAPAQTQDQARVQADLAARRAAASREATAAAARAQAVQRAARAAHRRAVQARAARAAALAKARQRRAVQARARAWVLPVAHYPLTSGFGRRWGRLHAGNDFAAPIGSRLVAMSSGTVTFAGAQSGYGNKVEIRYWDRTVSWYGHMDRVTARVGQKVAPGTLVGYSGNTGHSTGPHLHLEIHPRGRGAVDPKPWLRARGLRP